MSSLLIVDVLRCSTLEIRIHWNQLIINMYYCYCIVVEPMHPVNYDIISDRIYQTSLTLKLGNQTATGAAKLFSVTVPSLGFENALLLYRGLR